MSTALLVEQNLGLALGVAEHVFIMTKGTVVLGKKSGRYSVEHTLGRLGLGLEADGIDIVLEEIKRRSAGERRLIDDEEFLAIVNAYLPGDHP